MRGINRYVVRRLLGVPLVGAYLLVAALNFTVVQSYLGAWASDYFSKEWGATVRIGALHISPLSHVLIDDLLLVSPTNDTIYDGERLSVRFNHFPVRGGGIDVDRVKLKNVRYHLETFRHPDGSPGINLDFIIKHYAPAEPSTDTTTPPPFQVKVDLLVLDNVNYIQDLAEPKGYVRPAHGVCIPHMRYLDIHGRIKHVNVVNDSVTCRMVTFKTREASGLQVKELSMDVVVSPHIISATNMELVTGDSRLLLDARLEFPGWEGMSDYMNNVRHEVVFKEGTDADVCEAGYWAPTLWGAAGKCKIQGHFHGTIADMHAEDFVVAFGTDSYVYFDGALAGLPDIRTSTLKADLHRVHATYSDLAAVQHPDPIAMRFPELVKRLAVIDLEGSFYGGFSDLKTELSLNTRLGDLRLCAASQYDSALGDYVYMGEIDSRQVQLPVLLHNPKMPATGLHLTFQGTGFNPGTMDAQVDGSLYNTHLVGHHFAHTKLYAEVADQRGRLDISLHDPMGNFDIKADADLRDTSCRATLDLVAARLSDLRLVKADSNITLTTHLEAAIGGLDMERVSGSVELGKTDLVLGSRHIKTDGFLGTIAEQNGKKDILLKTDWFDLSLNGYFQYTDFPLIAKTLCSRYVPAYFAPTAVSDTPNPASLAAANFDLDLLWTDEEGRFSEVVKDLTLAKGTSAHLSFNNGESARIVFRSDEVSVGKMRFRDVGMTGRPVGENYRIVLQSGTFDVEGVPVMENIRLTAGAGRSLSTLALKWDDDPATVENQGDVEVFVSSSPTGNKLHLTKPTFYVGGDEWSITCPDGLFVSRERIEVDKLKVYGFGQSVALKALIEKSDNAFLKVAFEDYSLGHACNILLADKRVKVNGILDGKITVRGLNSTPNFDADLTVDDLVLNDQHAGKVDIKANYVPEETKLYLDMVSAHQVGDELRCPVELHGTMLTADEDNPQLDFVVNLRRVALQTAGPMIADITSNINGLLGGDLHIHGTPKSPKIDGMVTISNGELMLNASGVTYYFDDEFRISNGKLTLDDFAIHDKASNTALANGVIALEEGRLNLDLALKTDRITALDLKSEGDNPYGRVMASVDGTVKGYVDNLSVSATATALNGSELYVPVSNRKQIADAEYVTFVSNNREEKPRTAPAPKAGNFNLLLNLSVTPGLKLHLPMDFSELSANVTAIGNGDVRVSMNNGGPLSVLGDYVFSSGNFSWTLVSLITKNFTIEPGSTLNFPGTIEDARFNVSAIYSQRVNLASLSMQNTSGGSNNSYVQVQNVVNLSGVLSNPALKFDIRLPNAEQTVSDQVFSLIDRTSERDMLTQSMSLLLFGCFQNPSATTMEESGMGLNVLASSVGSVVSNMVKVVDVNFKYQAASRNTSGKFDVGISKQWNKFYFESTFGYGTGSNTADLQNNSIIGDVELGYKFTPYIQGLVFDRSNTSFYTRTEVPRKQGIGVKFSKDFNNIFDIFPWMRRKEETVPAQNKLK